MDEHVLHILLGFAGVGATFAGFSGVVAVFGRRAHGEWPPFTWALASLLLGLGSVVYLLYARPANQRLRRDRPDLMPIWASVVFVVALSVGAILQFLNIVGLFFERVAGAYLAGLLALLCAAAMQFAFMVIRPLSSVASDANRADSGRQVRHAIDRSPTFL